MSLATERQAGRLICTCPRPCPRPVILFDAITLTDVLECGHCARKYVTDVGDDLHEPVSARTLAHLGSEAG